jgi:hypothetical protein
MFVLPGCRRAGPLRLRVSSPSADVDPAETAFVTPVKPIGPFFERDEAQRLAAPRRWPIEPVWSWPTAPAMGKAAGPASQAG